MSSSSRLLFGGSFIHISIIQLNKLMLQLSFLSEIGPLSAVCAVVAQGVTSKIATTEKIRAIPR